MIVESCTGQLSDWEKNIQRMSLPQLLNYLHFLRWRRSSSKTKACKFLGNRSPHAVAAAPFDRQAFWPFFQIDSFPWFDRISAVYLKSTAGFAVTQPFFHHGFHDQLLKFWRVSFVWFSSWHNKWGAVHFFSRLSEHSVFVAKYACMSAGRISLNRAAPK